MRLPILSFLAAASFVLPSSGTRACAQAPEAQKSPATPSTAQAAVAAAAAAGGKDLYGGESFVIAHAAWVYDEKTDGTGYREHTVAVKLQSEASLRAFGVVAVPFASASEHVDLHYVRVRHADGSVTETPVSDVIEQPEQVTRDAPFYSDLKEDQLPVKNLRVGDTLEWQARIVRTRAEAPGQFWGEENFVGDSAVTLDDDLELRVPAGENVTVWTNPKPGTQPKITTEGEEKVYRWHHEQLKPTTGAEADAARKAKQAKVLTPDEELDSEQGKLPSIAWTTFQSWADVGTWYRGLEGTRMVPDDEIKARVAELIKDKTTDEAKVRAIYAFVSAQVRYIGVAFGVGRFQPHEASDVLHNQYGDCKDKATLLMSMLRAAGFDPDAVLIGAGIRMNKDVPSPSAFNHLINRVKVGNDEVWLDATQEVAPYRVLLFPLRGKLALVIPDKGAATLLGTPKDLPFPAIDTWTAVGTLNDQGTSESHIKMVFHSDSEVAVRSAIHSVAPAQYDDAAQRFMGGLGYAGKTSHAIFGRPEDTTEPYVFEVDYEREKAGDWDNLKTIPQLGPVELPTVDEKDPPTQSIDLGPTSTTDSTSEMKLPSGWTAQLPEAIHQKARWASIDETYRFDNGTIYVERNVQVFESKVPASEWKDYKRWTDACNLGYDKYIQLIRPGADGKPAAAGGAAGHISNKDAEEHISKGWTAAQKLDEKTAESELKQARDIDPQARGLWEAYGILALARGKSNEAIEDFRKELALYPQAFEAYGMIAHAQYTHHDLPAAETTARQWAAADPGNGNAEQALSAYLFEDKEYADAAEAAQKALTLTGADDKEKREQREEMLGRAQIKAGQIDKGEATMVGLLKDTDDPGHLNDAAYELADAKLQLPLDEEKVRIALSKMDAETEAWTLHEAPATLAQTSSLLAATWDTMGWILFREGKAKEARTFIEAAYANQHHKEVKDHLDQIDDALSVAHAPDSKKVEQEDRTVALGPYSGSKVVAEYRLLLSQGKVEVDEPTTDKTIGGADGMLKAASFANLFPEGSDAKLVRQGIVNCGSGKCEIVLEP